MTDIISRWAPNKKLRRKPKIAFGIRRLVMMSHQLPTQSDDEMISKQQTINNIKQMAEAVSNAESPVTFQYKAPSSRKRKFLRQRDYDDEEPAASNPTLVAAASTASATGTITISEPSTKAKNLDNEGEQPSLVDIAKLRKKSRSRQGLQLTVDTPKSGGNGERNVKEGAKKAEFEVIGNRFTHQTGQVLDVDKHMYVLLLRICPDNPQMSNSIGWSI